MIPEIGHFALIIAMTLSFLLASYPLYGALTQKQGLMKLARPLALGQFAFTFVSFLCLVWAFVYNDFTVAYVAHNSNTALPVYYRVSAVWGAHEGSLLLWVLILSGWTAAVALFSRALPLDAVARVLAVMGMVGIGFYLFVLLTSNPFDRLLPIFPIDGRDLNPLLQDVGLIIHPPLLYMGYVGFSVAFAFAISALMTGRLDSAWARWSRPWTMAAWIFLTLGIALGSWWAYYELGWGGWWFWDPVENASFMPWLIGTALIHSLAVTEKRGVFKAWTVLLAISAFSLSLLGTFLVRSGVLVSVHAFASDPARGLFILAFLGIVIGGSLVLFAWRGSEVKSHGRYELFSREVMLIGNNVFLTAATLVVLLGTLLPLFYKELGLGSISVGAPFFNDMFTVLVIPFAILLGIGPLTRWRRQAWSPLAMPLTIAGGMALLLAFVLPVIYADSMPWHAVLGLALALWVTLSTVQEIRLRIGVKNDGLRGLTRLTRSHWAMVLGHLGFAVTLIGIALTSSYTIEKDLRMVPGDTVEMRDYQFRFEGVKDVQGPNYSASAGILTVFEDGKQLTTLVAEKRFYPVQRSVMTEAAIDAGFTRDLYMALGEELTDGAWAVRIYYKPFVRWIWAGALLMSLGGLLMLMDRRYRMAKKTVVTPASSKSDETKVTEAQAV
ncbi:heme lyase CcmF/NrfE family subunit [Corallincola luteus]|uniref:Heme lyase CcmF/NrfE family subunit n=2 Tax=Corallincola TaxID=1775176 RepID=A0A368N230_9GAMM|nr:MULTISPECIES: heme lyase CcmF/NrfE family subunit [Corallincola]RCU44538.1 heme lyase CcmF/NrfE family subunit [Corallincola holothuriorum]TCI05410.1 heme lyase CcmF/NrfE family subunit [Corallincola luteus]